MTAAPQPTWTPAPRWGPGRIVALVIGLLLLLPALGLLLGGGVLLWADSTQRTDGYVFSDTDDFATQGYALSSERLDLATGADWVPLSSALGTARAEVSSTTPGQEIFIGIAPVDEGAAYLDGVERSVIDDLGTTAFDERVVTGGPPPGPPGEQDFWVASASGTGTQRLNWNPEQGNWLFVVMNADASAGVTIDARIGATVPALGSLAWGLIGVGVALLLIAALLLVLAFRRPRVVAVAPPASTPWSPPVPVDRTTAADAQPDPTRSGTAPPPPTG